MSLHQVHVFVSHSWAYAAHYDTLAQWIFKQNWASGQTSINFHNYSVPGSNPITGARTDKALREAIRTQIARSHVVVIPSGIYSTHSKWINEEIILAQELKKPILCVDLRGAVRTSTVVSNAANKTVGWNSKSVASGIWELYCGR